MKKITLYTALLITVTALLVSCGMFFDNQASDEGTVRITLGTAEGRALGDPASAQLPVFSRVILYAKQNGKTVRSGSFSGGNSSFSMSVPYGSGYEIELFAVVDQSKNPTVPAIVKAYGGRVKNISVNQAEIEPLIIDLSVSETAIMRHYLGLSNLELQYSPDGSTMETIFDFGSASMMGFPYTIDQYGRILTMQGDTITRYDGRAGAGDVIFDSSSTFVPPLISNMTELVYDGTRNCLIYLSNTTDIEYWLFDYPGESDDFDVNTSLDLPPNIPLAVDRDGYLYGVFSSGGGIYVLKLEVTGPRDDYEIRDVSRFSLTANGIVDPSKLRVVNDVLLIIGREAADPGAEFPSLFAVDCGTMKLKWSSISSKEYPQIKNTDAVGTLPLGEMDPSVYAFPAGWTRDAVYIQDRVTIINSTSLDDYYRVVEIDINSGKIRRSHFITLN
ncbi:hypothetical protein [Breznakiella homolactica]|uniref:Lipoprotein n=1 Tax=Breznakiella homolactica TaxID=2798577 RepID=A0A7T8BA97_9SPIR|nr:hypothetical protein [Breznakiella homolactica]QQO07998.1 hypothetical protein JFL75_13730 [Breznakiella homolactica]